MKVLRVPPMYKCVGLVDADLLDNGTRHPNLALLKIAGFLYDNNVLFELILDPKANIEKYERIFLSRVFTFTTLPPFYKKAKGTSDEEKFVLGGTGFYANEEKISQYQTLRFNDMTCLENDPFLNKFPNRRNSPKKNGLDMARQMPYYHLYDLYVQKQVELGHKKEKYKDYYNYSIGFLTRGCIRHCPFCINKLENKILPYSKLEWFLDTEKDENGHDVRSFVYLWDDNFLASDITVWKPLLQQLIDLKKPFQFRQGLDERMLAESPHGALMAEMLSKAHYHGDFIFAFDNWKDRVKIEKALKVWKHYNPNKGTKFYLFCGFKQHPDKKEKFYKDIKELFNRINVLMQYGCIGYVMRHEDYHNAPLSNIYVQIARWCNQPQFYKKMSFWEFTYRNQSYWEEHSLKLQNVEKIITFEQFQKRQKLGYYNNVKMCLPLRTFLDILAMFPEQKTKLLEYFNYKMINLINPQLWQ